MTPRPSLGAEVRSRSRPHCGMMGISAGSSRGITMIRAIVVSNTNDHGSDEGGCQGGSLYRIQMIMAVMSMDVSLYQIQMIMMVANVDVETDRCIEYKQLWW